MENFFDHLCGSNGEGTDGDEFELKTEGDDDDCVSVVSSCVGSHGEGHDDELVADDNGPGGDDVADWENLNEKERAAKITSGMKKLGNIKKRRISKFILKDVLGRHGDLAIKDIKKKHLKQLRRYKLKINTVYRAVKYFEQKMSVRRERLRQNIQKSKLGTYSQHRYWWREKYLKIMKEKRAARQQASSA